MSETSTTQERLYCSRPIDCLRPDVFMIGSAIRMSIMNYLVQQATCLLGYIPSVVVADAGPMDVLGHLAHCRGFIRHPFVKTPERMGGRLSLWGLSTPRPPIETLKAWPY